MSEAKDTAIALNVRLKPGESSAHPHATNYTNLGVAQGIAYVDFAGKETGTFYIFRQCDDLMMV